MAEHTYDKDACILLLRRMQGTLALKGETRLPRRADFEEKEAAAIKSFLGPWPRALEAAGLKEEREDGKKEKALQKRIAAKRKKTAAKIQRKEKEVP